MVDFELSFYQKSTEEVGSALTVPKTAVIVLSSDEKAIVTIVLLRLANVERPTDTSFEGLWSTFTIR